MADEKNPGDGTSLGCSGTLAHRLRRVCGLRLQQASGTFAPGDQLRRLDRVYRRITTASAAAEDPPAPGAVRIWFFRLTSATLAVGIALVCGETAVRLFDIGPDFCVVSRWNYRFSQDPVLWYELFPGSREGSGKINEDCMRDRSYPVEKPGGTFRIACAGDSICYGAGVERSQSYAKRLEVLLNRQSASGGPTFEVLNFGVVGYNATQVVENVRARALKYDPDVVLYGYCLNDPEEYSLEFDALRKGLTAAETDYLDWMLDRGAGWARRSRLYTFIRYAWKSRTVEGKRRDPTDPRGPMDLWRGDYADYYAGLHERAAGWQRVEVALAALAEVSSLHRIPAYLVIFPVFRDLDTYPLAAVHHKVRVAAERQGLPVLDLLDTYRSAQRAGESFVHDLAHPDAGGHAIAAAALLRFLQANGHLPAS